MGFQVSFVACSQKTLTADRESTHVENLERTIMISIKGDIIFEPMVLLFQLLMRIFGKAFGSFLSEQWGLRQWLATLLCLIVITLTVLAIYRAESKNK